MSVNNMLFAFANNFQLQIYLALLALLIAFTFLWLYFLQQYFILLKKFDEGTFIELGSPNIKLFKLPKESDLLKHLFSDGVIDNQHLKIWHKRLRHAFLLYILFFVLICAYIVFSTLI